MTDVTTTQSTDLSTVSADAFGAAPAHSEDIVIPKIQVMQKMSNLVDEGVAKEGDFVDSLSQEVIGGLNEPVAFIPFYMEKLWFISKKVGGRWELEGIEAFSNLNKNLRYFDTVNGEDYKNELHMRFYALRPEDMSIPYIITFKGMSQKAGKALYTQMYIKNKAAGLTPAGKVMLLKGEKRENDNGKFVVTTCTPDRTASAEEVNQCLEWFHTIQAGSAKVDESDQRPAGQTEGEQTNTAGF